MNKTENVTLANPIDNRSLGLNNNISIPKLAIEDIAETSSMVAEELKEKTPDELYIYPLSDLSAAEIEKALKGLSPADLERVLVNISPETFDEIMHFKLSQDKVDEIINMLPLEKRQGILNRVS